MTKERDGKLQGQDQEGEYLCKVERELRKSASLPGEAYEKGKTCEVDDLNDRILDNDTDQHLDFRRRPVNIFW